METQYQMTVINRTIKHIILLIFFLGFTCISAYSQNEQSYLVSNVSIKDFSINGLYLSELNDPGDKFDKLSSLGKPINKTYRKTFVEEIWEYEYSGIKLTYVNVNGYPELSEMLISEFNPAFKICFKKNKIDENTSLESISTTFLSKNSNKINGKYIEKNISINEKFENKSNFMEIQLKNEKISGIFLKNKII